MTIDTLELLKLEEVKARFGLVDKELPFQTVDDKAYDVSLLNLVETANRHFTLDLVPILGQIDLTETGLWKDCQNTAYTYFLYLFQSQMNHVQEEADRHKKEYKDQLKTLINAVTSGMPDRPNRAKLAVFSSAVNGKKRIVLPGNKFDTILD